MMDADRPLKPDGKDRLGFQPVAKHLANVLTNVDATQGLVLGIEGAWGSGKSSLIGLVKAELEVAKDRPEVVDFAPWLVGDRQTLLTALIGEITRAAINIKPIEEGIAAEAPTGWWARARNWIDQARGKKPSDALARMKKVDALRSRIKDYVDGIVKTEAIIETLTKRTGAQDAGVGAASLSERKQLLTLGLQAVSRRIIVFVDDLDRLEPKEGAEVMRLIRAVADFPNVVYVLSYDPEVLAETLQNAVLVKNGRAFLEKIVQVRVRVPQPEDFDLRTWFSEEVYRLLGEGLDEPTRGKLDGVIGMLGGRMLKTPRDVVRTLNALEFQAVPVRDKIYVPDMVWLQLVGLKVPELHTWIEQYMTNVASVALGAMVTDGDDVAACEEMKKFLPTLGHNPDRARFELSRIVPGTEHRVLGNDRERDSVYYNLSRERLAPFIADKRLGSPHHYRTYFAFCEPAGSVGDAVVSQFLDRAGSSEKDAVALLGDLTAARRPQGGTKGEVLIERLELVAGSASITTRVGVASVLGALMDSMADVRGDFGRSRAWDAATRLLRICLDRLAVEERRQAIDSVFERGAALGFASHVLRQEIFAHGTYGHRPDPEDQWLLRADEFERIVRIMQVRYQTTDPAALRRTPRFFNILFAWLQSGDEHGVKGWVAREIASAEGLLEVLDLCRGWSSGSDGVRYLIRKNEVGCFMDFDAAITRVKAIEADVKSSSTMRAKATGILASIEMD